MLIERHGRAVTVRAPAKVNLFLEVLARRPDGYHDIATLMVAVTLYDTLTFAEDPAGAVSLRADRADLDVGPGNLVCRAAELLRRHAGRPLGARIGLTKRIPIAAGLAGGSTDAAATLAGLNVLWGLGLGWPELARLGSEVGSDIAFFFAGGAAWCTGRGEIVTPERPGRPLDLVLVCPNFGLSTAEVYRGVTVPAQPRAGDAARQALAAGRVDDLGRELHNRLHEAAVKLRPEVATRAARLEALGPAGRLMSGSGSTLFALCRSPEEALRLARRLRNDPAPEAGGGSRVYVVRSCS